MRITTPDCRAFRPPLTTSPASTKFYVHSANIAKYTISFKGTYQFQSAGANAGMHDWSNLINKSIIQPGQTQVQAPQCGSNGIFYNKQASDMGWICSGTTGTDTTLNTPYLGLDNAQVLLKAWAYFYSIKTDSVYPRWAELWAEQTATVSSASESNTFTPDYWLNNYFPCSREAMNLIDHNGASRKDGNGQPILPLGPYDESSFSTGGCVGL